jgi:glycerol-3-phosphate dehydrogenase
MAEDTVNTAISRGKLADRPCVTATLPIHGAMKVNFDDPQHYHGADAAKIRELAAERPEWGGMLHPRLPYLKAEMVWAVREELCMTVEDALSRRTRSLLLDAQAAIECAEPVARLLAAELGRDREWQVQQVEEFKKIAEGYLAPVRITS